MAKVPQLSWRFLAVEARFEALAGDLVHLADGCQLGRCATGFFEAHGRQPGKLRWKFGHLYLYRSTITYMSSLCCDFVEHVNALEPFIEDTGIAPTNGGLDHIGGFRARPWPERVRDCRT